MVANHRELQLLMDRINSSGQGEITFWEFIAAFKPPKEGAPPAQTADMKKLRLLLATVEHETLTAAFSRDHAEDGLSDAEAPAIALYASRAEGRVRAAQRAAGDARAAERWFERMAKGGSSVAPGGAVGGPSKTAAASARAAAERRRTEAALARESHLTLNTRIGLHRRRFLLTSIMQEKERHISKGADLLAALHAAEVRGDLAATTTLHKALGALNQTHNKRIDRLAATALVVDKEREAARKIAAGEVSDSDDDGDDEGGEEEEEEADDGGARITFGSRAASTAGGSRAGSVAGGARAGSAAGGSRAGSVAGGGRAAAAAEAAGAADGIDEGAAGGAGADGEAAAPPTALAIEIGLTASRMPCLSELIKNCQRFILAAEASATASAASASAAAAGAAAEAAAGLGDDDLL